MFCSSSSFGNKEIPGVDGQFVRLSRSKTFRWLLCKVDDAFEAVGSGLAGRVAFVGGAAVARSLVVEEVAEDVASKALSEEGKRAIAVELVCSSFARLFFVFERFAFRFVTMWETSGGRCFTSILVFQNEWWSEPTSKRRSHLLRWMFILWEQMWRKQRSPKKARQK